MTAFAPPVQEPGPNDHHVPKGTTHLEPGLGPDQPSALSRAELRAAGEAHIREMREQLAVEVTSLEAREAALAKREAALEAREAKAKKSPSAPDEH